MAPDETTEQLAPAFDPHVLGKGGSLTFHDAFGERHDLEADADGAVWPTSQVEADHLASLGLPVARKALKEAKAAIAEAAETATKEG